MHHAHRYEEQLQLSFDAPEDRHDFPEAITNEHGVMIGNLIRRSWSTGRDSLTITMGRNGDAWAAGADLKYFRSGRCFAPSINRLFYSSAEEAFEDRRRQSALALDKGAYFAIDNATKKAAEALLAVMRGPYIEEIIHGIQST